MKVTVESTTLVVVADGIECRVWEGKTAGGIEVQLLVARVAVPVSADEQAFREELQQTRAPQQQECFPARMIL